MNKVLVAKHIRNMILVMPHPKDITIKSLKEWKFPVGDTYYVHRPSEVMLATYYKNEPIGIFNYFVEDKNIKISSIQGVQIKDGKPIYERPWTEPVMQALILASAPFIKQGYEVKFNEALVHEIKGWKEARSVFQKEVASFEKQLATMEKQLLTSTHKDEFTGKINEVKHDLLMSTKKVDHYNNMLGIYGTVRNMYFDEKEYTLSLKKPKTANIVAKFDGLPKKEKKLPKEPKSLKNTKKELKPRRTIRF